MLKSTVKLNLKTILRDPTTLLAVLIAIIMQFMYGLNDYGQAYLFDMYAEPEITAEFNGVMNEMMNMFAKPVAQIAFPFLGVIIAVNLFKEMRFHTYDIMSVGQISFRQFYFGKLIAYYLLGLMMGMILGFCSEIFYLIKERPFQLEVDWFAILGSQIAWMFALYTSCLLIPISIGVFAASVSGVSLTAPIVNCAYYYLPMMTPITKLGIFDYIHVIPDKLFIFMKYWVVYPNDWYHVEIGNDLSVRLGMKSSFKDALISYGLVIVIAVLLLSVSYFLLKRRYEKA